MWCITSAICIWMTIIIINYQFSMTFIMVWISLVTDPGMADGPTTMPTSTDSCPLPRNSLSSSSSSSWPSSPLLSSIHDHSQHHDHVHATWANLHCPAKSQSSSWLDHIDHQVMRFNFQFQTSHLGAQEHLATLIQLALCARDWSVPLVYL